MTILILAGAILLEIAATLSLKASEGFTRKVWLIPVVVGYGGALALLGVVLARGMGVGIAYGIWAASGVALTAVFGRLIFKDPLSWVMGLGIALIMGGVIAVELGGSAAL
jgi:small multidrug resistance pump